MNYPIDKLTILISNSSQLKLLLNIQSFNYFIQQFQGLDWILIKLIDLKLKFHIAVESSSVNLEIIFQTMFCWFQVATVDRFGVAKKNGRTDIRILGIMD